jgi:hypothetical protein
MNDLLFFEWIKPRLRKDKKTTMKTIRCSAEKSRLRASPVALTLTFLSCSRVRQSTLCFSAGQNSLHNALKATCADL